MSATTGPYAGPAPTDEVQAMRDQWAADDARILATLDDLDTRAAHVLTAPGLPAPVVELGNVVRGLVDLLRREMNGGGS